MKNIVIFSGTTEGRLLAESFAAADIPVTVCVATEYGEEVMTPDPHISIHKGRMDAAEMTDFLHGADAVFDATHPYATEVSKNIMEACAADGILYKRIERSTPVESHDSRTVTNDESHDGHVVTHVKSTAEAVEKLEATEGRIFLTTGSKELKDFESLQDRLYVRVLPSREAIGICEDCSIEKSHIIAQQGPFTYEENLALIRRYDIGVLVTKNSGRNGGYDEKIRAAETAGIPVITIDRPSLTADRPISASDRCASAPSVEHNQISIIGAGCGENTLTLEAAEAVRRADAIIGTKRLLDYDIVKQNPCPKYNAYKADEIVKLISSIDGRAAVLFSGDTGFYSGAAGLLQALPDVVDVKVYPGISSVSALSAKTGIAYDHAVIKSYHGIEIDEKELRQTVSDNQATFLLLSGAEDAEKVCHMFPDRQIFIASDMGTDHEWSGEIRDGSLFHLSGNLYTMVIMN